MTPLNSHLLRQHFQTMSQWTLFTNTVSENPYFASTLWLMTCEGYQCVWGMFN